LYLVKRHGHLVEKDELLDWVWADTIVTDAAMAHCIEEIRKALGDDAYQPRFLKTISRVGYKFIAPVVAINVTEEEIVEEEFLAMKVKLTDENQESVDEFDAFTATSVPAVRRNPSLFRLPSLLLTYWSLVSHKITLVLVIFLLMLAGGLFLHHHSHHTIHSLAVLPLTNLNADPAQDYFDDGMTEELITELAKISAIRVISRTSVMQYKGAYRPLSEIARELHVDAVVEGSLFYSGEHVRITAQLIQASPERHLWAESYDREMGDILSLQKEVTKAIAKEIKAKLTPHEKAHLDKFHQVKPEAYQAYLKGRYFWNTRTLDGFNKGIECFNQAIAIDPNYAPAFAGLADCYNLLDDYNVLPPNEAIPLAKVAAEKALAIDSTLAEAHASLGFAQVRYDWNWIGAEKEFKRAIELKPNYADAHHWYALQLAMMGRFKEAINEIYKAQKLDPLSLIINTNIGWLYFFERKYDLAEEQLKRTLEMDQNFIAAHVKLGWVYEQQEKYNDAIAQFKNALALYGNKDETIGLFGNCYAMSGQRAEALKIVNKLIAQSKHKYVSAYWIAIIYASLGEKDHVFEWLYKAAAERNVGLIWLKAEPKLDRFRADPRFFELLRIIGLK
jgi:TolB-like protein/DNA-binding winged helix-turn-helix (wHTH) protein/Tfp pilus assembly protein PilF